MSEAEIRVSRLSDPQDAEVTQYRAVSRLALSGLIVALFAPLAFAHPLLWAVPLAAIVICLSALKRIAREAPALIGRKAAVAGLVLSVLFGTAAAAQHFTYGRLLDGEAQKFADQWFEFLRRNEPEKSHQLTQYPGSRLPLDEKLPAHYPPGSKRRSELYDYLRQPAVRSLLALGDKALVRYYDTGRRYRSQWSDVIEQVYAVTYKEAGEKKSFFVELTLKRYYISDAGRAYWQLFDSDAAIRPKGMGSGE